MKANQFFKRVAVCAIAIPTMLLTTACSSDDDDQHDAQASVSSLGYATPVTIKAYRDGIGDATRSQYNEEYHTIGFTDGDQLFYRGQHETAGLYSALLQNTGNGVFSGTLYRQNPYTVDAADLIKSGRIQVSLIPEGYENYGYMELSGEGYNMNLLQHTDHAFATDKKTAIEQFYTVTSTYYDNGIHMRATNGVISCTINGLKPSTSYPITFRSYNTSNKRFFDISGTATSNASGQATFAIGTTTYTINTRYFIIIDEGKEYMDIDLGYRAIKANSIVNVTKSATARQLVDISTLPTGDYVAEHGQELTGTLPAGVHIKIADGATVMLKDATFNSSIRCIGDATIILEGENTVHGTEAGIMAGPEDKTLTIKGDGTLTVTGNANCAAIGTGEGGNYGNITIEGGNIIATAGADAAAIGTGVNATCQKIFIDGGWVEATGGNNGGAGIGTGKNGTCGQIVIRNAVGVKATKGYLAQHSVGAGQDGSFTSVLIGGHSGAKEESTYVYPEKHWADWGFTEPQYFDLAAGKDYGFDVVLRSTGLSGGTVVDGHMTGTFNFIAPYNRKFTKIMIYAGHCTSVTGTEGWQNKTPGAVWEGTPQQYVFINADIADITRVYFEYQ